QRELQYLVQAVGMSPRRAPEELMTREQLCAAILQQAGRAAAKMLLLRIPQMGWGLISGYSSELQKACTSELAHHAPQGCPPSCTGWFYRKLHPRECGAATCAPWLAAPAALPPLATGMSRCLYNTDF